MLYQFESLHLGVCDCWLSGFFPTCQSKALIFVGCFCMCFICIHFTFKLILSVDIILPAYNWFDHFLFSPEVLQLLQNAFITLPSHEEKRYVKQHQASKTMSDVSRNWIALSCDLLCAQRNQQRKQSKG